MRQSLPVCAALDMENIEQFSALRITPTVRALSSALRGKRENVPECSQKNGDRIFPEPEKLWFKESTAKNLRTRDFLSPITMLNTLYADGQVSLVSNNCLITTYALLFLPRSLYIMDECSCFYS